MEPRSRQQSNARDSTRDLIAKKREIFLVQMGLDVKSQEIAKLRERAELRDEALTKAEKMLEEDTKKFDNFLKDNAARLQEAMAHAETQTRAKQEKVDCHFFETLCQHLLLLVLETWHLLQTLRRIQ